MPRSSHRGNSGTYTEGSAAVAISPNFTVGDIDSATLSQAAITLTFHPGDVLHFVAQNGITGDYDPFNSGILNLFGTASVADYQAAIRSVTFSSGADANFGGAAPTRSFTYVVVDASSGMSNVGHSTLTIVDSGGTANDDSVSTNENAVLNGNVENNNGSGADTGVTSVTAVNGNAADVGTQITLASGAKLTLNANGTFSYDPNDGSGSQGLRRSGAGGRLGLAHTLPRARRRVGAR